jgi:hypothetical protein
MSRYELVTIAAVTLLGIYLLMLRGWRSRQRRQGFLPVPPVATAESTTVVGAVPGLFVGTTFAGDWLDRVAVHGLCNRSTADLSLKSDGVHIDREGGTEIYLPYDVIDGASIGDKLAGKVMGAGGLLIITWRLGGSVLTSAFRADDHSQHARLVDAIHAHLPVNA